MLKVHNPNKKKERNISEYLLQIEVSGAGTEVANGIYKKSDEVKNDKPVWKKEESNAFIMWWNTSCGFELYSNGMKGCCSYWTKGSPGTTPVNSTWSVRGDAAPAPKMKEVR